MAAAANIDISSSGINLETNESLNTLGDDLVNLIQEATFSNFDDDAMGDNAVIIRKQAGAPSAVEYDVWRDSTLDLLRSYIGPSGGNRWAPLDGTGEILTNDTGTTRSAGDCVGDLGSSANSFDGDAGAGDAFAGVVMESIDDGSAGYVLLGGYCPSVKVDGTVAAITRGDFLIVNASAGAYMLAGTSTATETCGIALESSSSQNTIKAWIWPENGP